MASLVCILSAAFLGFLGYNLAFGAYYTHFVDMKLRYGKACAAALDGETLSLFSRAETNLDPDYKKMFSYLNTCLGIDPAITYLFTLLPDDQGGLHYAVDGGLSMTDTLWVETPEFALECFIDENGKFALRADGTIQQKRFTLKGISRDYLVDFSEGPSDIALYVDGVMIAKFRKGDRLKVWCASRLLSESEPEFDVVFKLKDDEVLFGFSISYAGESISIPGSSYLDTSENIAILNRVLSEGESVRDDSPIPGNYGPLMAFRLPVRDGKGAVRGILVLGVSASEINRIKNSIIITLATAFVPVALLAMAVIFLFMKKTVATPLSALLEGISRIRFGEDDYMVDIHTHDEFESFADSFNALIVTVRENRVALEETVTERTKDLEAALAELRLKSGKLEELAKIDSMTGLVNKHEILQSLDVESVRLKRYGDKPRAASSLVFIDLDNFKYLNDTFGHPAGDVVLKKFAHLLSESARTCDITGRYGGDEFLVLLPDTPPDKALYYVNRIMTMLEFSDFLVPEIERFLGHSIIVPHEKHLGFSCGISAFKPGDVTADVIARADTLLYEAKNSGKGKTVIDPAYKV